MEGLFGRRHRPGGRTGFSLLEALLAVVITAILLGGVYTMFGRQEEAQVLVDQMAEMNQDLRVAALWITRDLRLAGHHMEGGLSTTALPGDLSAVSVADGNPGDNTVPDTLTVIYADSNVQAAITSPMPNESAELNVSSTTGFSDGDLVIITDGANTSLFCVSEVQVAALKLQHNSGVLCGNYNDPGGHGNFPGYGAGARIYRATMRVYSIDRTDANHPILMMQEGLAAAQPLVDYIENLQVVPTNANNQEYTVTIAARTRRAIPGIGVPRRKTMVQQVRVRNL